MNRPPASPHSRPPYWNERPDPDHEDLSLIDMSPRQRAVWFTDRLAAPKANVHVARALSISGDLAAQDVEKALTDLAGQWPAVQRSVRVMDGQPFLCPIPPRIDFRHIDATGWPPERVDERLRADLTAPFDVTGDPFLRARLYRTGPRDWVLVLIVHAIAADHQSIAMAADWLMNRLGHGQRIGRDPDKAAEAPNGDNSEIDQSECHERARTFWRQQLSGDIPVLELPLLPRQEETYQTMGNAISADLEPSQREKLRRLAGQHGAHPDDVLLAVLQVAMMRWAGQNGCALGLSVISEGPEPLQRSTGTRLNTIVLRAEPIGAQTSLATYLDATRRRLQACLSHADFPFNALVEQMSPTREFLRDPMFRVSFVSRRLVSRGLQTGFQRNIAIAEPGPPCAFGRLRAASLPLPLRPLAGELTVFAGGDDEEVRISISYNDAVPTDVARQFLKHLRDLLAAMLDAPAAPIVDAPLHFPEPPPYPEYPGGLHRSHAHVTFRPADTDQSVVARILDMAASHPARSAAVSVDRRLTYAELVSEAGEVAAEIVHHCGADRGRIGIYCGHDTSFVIGVVAAWLAAKAYVPLDPTFPEERLAHIAKSAEIDGIVSTRAYERAVCHLPVGRVPVVFIDDERSTGAAELHQEPMGGDALAYILYTSGSTGGPKGVMQNHRNVLHQLRTYTNNFRIDRHDVLIQLASFNWDASITDFLAALVNGACVALYDFKRDGIAGLAAFMARQTVTLYHSAPSLFRLLVKSIGDTDGAFPGIRAVLLAGEQVYGQDFALFKRHFAPDAVFASGYGATESSFALQNHQPWSAETAGRRFPLGHAIDGVDVVLLDETGHETIFKGEIALRGRHLAPGYWNRPDLSDRAFTPLSGDPALRQYRTGDIGYRRPDGAFVYGGRKDRQVKVRGYRIEPGEIESALRNIDGVTDAHVSVHDSGGTENGALAGHIVETTRGVHSSFRIRSELRIHLPDYMIPSHILFYDELPRTPNGKVDIRALGEITPLATVESTHGRELAHTPTEQIVASAWADILDVEEVGVDQNFFDLGGHSLLLAKVQIWIEATFRRRVPLVRLFEYPTVATLARFLDEGGSGTSQPSDAILRMAARRRHRRARAGNPEQKRWTQT